MSAPAAPRPATAAGQTESPAQDHHEDIASLRSGREANGNLTSLFIDHIGDGSVDSESGEQQGSGRKKSRHFHRESPDRKRGRNHVIQGLCMEDGKSRVDRLDLIAAGGPIPLRARHGGERMGYRTPAAIGFLR